ncbi:MAG TPA: NAD(P)-dependent alcohol dehydrogenase [Thermoanaerobaculia bacterium]|nr:NAD(P)-dependent alcohol dehydrogenase [Thermoanaerobaculia bacterium]
MKAIVYRGYGSPDVLECEEIAKPTPGDDEVLIKIRAASINPIDRHFMRGRPPFLRIAIGLRKPRMRPGRDVAGQVEAVGRNVTQFKPGDEVFGVCSGALAEYACTRESALVTKPSNVTFDQAASVGVAGLTALQGLRDKGKIRPGQKVLINGAGGGVGTFAVQIAKSFGADVTGVCSTGKVDMVRSLGADHVIDYSQHDFTESTQRYDLIFDLAATHSLPAYRRVLNPNGTCVIGGGPTKVRSILTFAFDVLVLSRFVSQNFVMYVAKLSKEDLTTLRELMEAGKVTPVIDRVYRLSEVRDAFRHLEEGHARGKIVVAAA